MPGLLVFAPNSDGSHLMIRTVPKEVGRLWHEHEITAHGFRAPTEPSYERLGIDPVVLELSLSHKIPGALRCLCSCAATGSNARNGAAVGKLSRSAAATGRAKNRSMQIESCFLTGR
jgi:hypothetical protein